MPDKNNRSKILRWPQIFIFLVFAITVCKAIADDLNNGFMRLSEGKPEEAIRLWTPLAKAGDKVAQASLGLLYQTGQGTKPDHARAVELFKKSAKQGYPFAFTALANSYHEGLGVEKSSRLALFWFLLSADVDPNAAYMVEALAKEIPSPIFDEVVADAIKCQASNYNSCGL